MHLNSHLTLTIETNKQTHTRYMAYVRYAKNIYKWRKVYNKIYNCFKQTMEFLLIAGELFPYKIKFR